MNHIFLKPYFNLNTNVRKKAKNDFENIFCKLMNNVVSLKIMENIITHRDIKIVKTEGKRDYLVSEPNHHTTQFFTEKLLAKEKKKKQNTYE